MCTVGPTIVTQVNAGAAEYFPATRFSTQRSSSESRRLVRHLQHFLRGSITVAARRNCTLSVMDSSAPMMTMEPRPMSPSNPHPHPHSYPAGPPRPGSAPQIGLHLGPESQIPDHPGSYMDVPRPSNGYGQRPSNSYGQMTSTVSAPTDVKQLKSQCQFNLREYQTLLRKRQRPDSASTTAMDLESRLRSQQVLLLSNLKMLRDEVKTMVKDAENHRWRKWLLGGAV